MPEFEIYPENDVIFVSYDCSEQPIGGWLKKDNGKWYPVSGTVASNGQLQVDSDYQFDTPMEAWKYAKETYT